MEEECQEPKCTRLATRIWHKRKVCQDHYEQHEESEYEHHNASGGW